MLDEVLALRLVETSPRDLHALIDLSIYLDIGIQIHNECLVLLGLILI